MTPPVDLYFEHLQVAGDRLRRTGYSRFKTDLKRYLTVLASHPLAARAVDELEAGIDLESWLESLGDPFTADPPDFPDEPGRDAAVRLALARLFARDIEAATDFGIRLSTAHDYETLIGAVIETVLHPLIDDLPDLLLPAIQKLERGAAQAAGGVSASVPTNPHDPRWAAILHVLDTLSEVLEPAPNPVDRTGARAELLAGASLIRSGWIRPTALRALLTADDGALNRSWSEATHAALADKAVRLIDTALKTRSSVDP